MRTCLLFSVLAASLLSACATPPSPPADRHGAAVNAAKAQQTIHPDAGRAADAARGTDGRPLVDAMERYEQSFRAPPPTFNVINIGAGGGSAR